MPKIPKAREISKVLQSLGFVLVRQSGSHAIYENLETKVQAIVPVHGGKEISIGVFKRILRDLDLGIDEFWKIK